MAVIKPTFLRPIEITASNNSFSLWLDDDGLGNDEYTFNIATGVYGSVFTLVGSLCETVSNTSPNIPLSAEFVESGDDLKIKFTLDLTGIMGAATPEATWNEIYDIIGAAGSAKNDQAWSSPDPLSYSTMTYRPTHMWIPTYQSAEQGRFYVDQNELFKGSMAKSGFVSGNRNGSTIYWRDLNFVNEPAENIYRSAATNSRMPIRTLEEFAEQCRSVSTTVSGNPSVKGFYYFPDWTDLQTDVSNLTNDNGGINFDYSSGADTYVFCQMDVRGNPIPQPSLPTTKTRYTTGFQIHTVDYTVSWTYYS